jgi:polysaccharide pyruvyl transferase WcaK-like protein
VKAGVRISRAFQISVGFGAGNIGDEFMAHAFWDNLPPSLSLEVALFPEHARQHEPYPPQHHYVPVRWGGNENEHVGDAPGLLAGDTPVTEAEGLHWPLEFLAPRLTHFHDRGLPVYALGVGVDRLESQAACDLFRSAFLPIRSWTVRSAACRDALLAMGVPDDDVIVGADWAWLYRPRLNRQEWAVEQLRALGLDPSAPLLIANIVNMIWQDAIEARRAIAASFDELSARHGFQVCFFSNECRDGEFFDFAAAGQIRDMMKRPAVLFPNLYYSPDEALGVLSHATVTVAQRYHFAIESVLAGSVPVCLIRGQKMRGLVEEMDMPAAGTVERTDSAQLTSTVLRAAENRSAECSRLQAYSLKLRDRARRNLEFLARDFPELIQYQPR